MQLKECHNFFINDETAEIWPLLNNLTRLKFPADFDNDDKFRILAQRGVLPSKGRGASVAIPDLPGLSASVCPNILPDSTTPARDSMS
jgi:hypothetical protein